jgi:small subunit ribosomal protein S1
MEVRVIDVNQSENRLVLSAREILKEQENAEKAKQIQSIQIGSITEGVVETLQNYGAFVKLDSGLSGLVHVSQISHKRIKTPGEVLKVGNKVKVKIIGLKEGKISLSIKALDDRGPASRDRDFSPKVDIPKSENIGTSLGDLFKDIKLD